jgi:hypothetical protein
VPDRWLLRLLQHVWLIRRLRGWWAFDDVVVLHVLS